MSKCIDLTGNRYGRLVVVRRSSNTPTGQSTWECVCDCGKTKIVKSIYLRNGTIRSCGCMRAESKPSLRHGMSKTKLYFVWGNIKERCCNEKNQAYKNYGGRGIKMCDSWKNSFESFQEWAINSGYSEGLSIERINVNGDYCPENCTWIPNNEQQNNRTTCRLYTYNGETKNLAEWCKHFNLPYGTVYTRLYRWKWSFERAMSEPVHVEKSNKKE